MRVSGLNGLLTRNDHFLRAGMLRTRQYCVELQYALLHIAVSSISREQMVTSGTIGFNIEWRVSTDSFKALCDGLVSRRLEAVDRRIM